MKIVVFGMGYVGLSLATLLSQKNEVVGIDVVESKVKSINKRISPIKDKYIEDFFASKPLNLVCKNSLESCDVDANFFIIATPTNYNEVTNSFDTSSIETVLELLCKKEIKGTIVIKSTIPIGYTKRVSSKYPKLEILFSPEFLREGRALEDNLFPSRIIVGYQDNNDVSKAELFAESLNNCAFKQCEMILMGSTEAEAVKLFANSYLATRVAFFNELDTYAEINNLDSSKIIHGMSMDPRIGDFYNNPSFGYGGYCLPKDTKQLKAEFSNVPNNVVNAIVDANVTRGRYIASKVIEIAKTKEKHPVIGIYRLIMKAGSDNFRSSSIQNIISVLMNENIDMIIFEPSLENEDFMGIKVIKNFKDFCDKSTIIIANRKDDMLSSLSKDKLYTRDIYGQN